MRDVITIPVVVEYLEEDEVYCVSTPLLPGCRAWGETLDEAMRAMPGNTRAMIAAWKEKGLPLPPPLHQLEPTIPVSLQLLGMPT